MRQAGYKPKNHNSGVYWIRASSNNKVTNDAEKEEEKVVFNSISEGAFWVGIALIILYALFSS